MTIRRITWTASTDPGTSGYLLVYDTQSRSDWSLYALSVDVGNVTEHFLSGLTPGATYYLRVVSYEAVGTTQTYGVSSEISFIAPGLASAAIGLPAVSVSAAALAGAVASAAVQLPAVSVSAAGAAGALSDASLSLPSLRFDGDIPLPAVLDAALNLPLPGVSAIVDPPISCSAALTLPAVLLQGSAEPPITMSAALVFPVPMMVTATIVQDTRPAATIVLPLPQVSGAMGLPDDERVLDADLVLPGLSATAVSGATHDFTCSGAVLLSALTVSAAGTGSVVVDDNITFLPIGHVRKVLTRSRLWSEECQDVDPNSDDLVPAYEFSGRTFRQRAPYGPAE